MSIIDQKNFLDYIRSGQPLKPLFTYGNDFKNEDGKGIWLQQLLPYVRNIYHQDIQKRYDEIGSLLERIGDWFCGDAIYHGLPRHLKRHGLKGQKAKDIFLSGGAAAYLLGRFHDYNDLDIYVITDSIPRSSTGNEPNEDYYLPGLNRIQAEVAGRKLDFIFIETNTLGEIYQGNTNPYHPNHYAFFLLFRFPRNFHIHSNNSRQTT